MTKIQPFSTETFSAPAFAITISTMIAIWVALVAVGFHLYPSGSPILFGSWNVYLLAFWCLALTLSWGVGSFWAGQTRKTKSGKDLIPKQWARGIAIASIAYMIGIAFATLSPLKEMDDFMLNVKAGVPITTPSNTLLASGAHVVGVDAGLKNKILAAAAKL